MESLTVVPLRFTDGRDPGTIFGRQWKKTADAADRGTSEVIKTRVGEDSIRADAGVQLMA